MTIDKAIEHAEERACGNDQCAKDHAQLADWLRELRRARMEIDLLKTLRDGFKADAQKYKAENAKLRETLKNALTYIEYEGCVVECPETGSSATLTQCDTCNRYETENCAYVIAQSARELGIEVEDA